MLQDITVGYGYRPGRAALWLLALLTVGSTVFAARPPTRTSSAGTQAFNPVVYTLDRLLPVVGFGQAAAFTPSPTTQWAAYALTAAGWLLTTTLAAGLARTLNRS